MNEHALKFQLLPHKTTTKKSTPIQNYKLKIPLKRTKIRTKKHIYKQKYHKNTTNEENAHRNATYSSNFTGRPKKSISG